MAQLSVATHANLPVFRSIAEVLVSDYQDHTATLSDYQQHTVALTDRQQRTVTLSDYVPDEE